MVLAAGGRTSCLQTCPCLASLTASISSLALRLLLPSPASTDVSLPLSPLLFLIFELCFICLKIGFWTVSAVAEGYWLKQLSMSPYSGSSPNFEFFFAYVLFEVLSLILGVSCPTRNNRML